MAQNAVRALVDAGSDPANLLVALGPSIGACCYEVGPEVEAAFGSSGAPFFIPGPAGRKHLDLEAANRAQLAEIGVAAANVDGVSHCTKCREDLFFSYRRAREASPLGEGANAGRMISVAGFSLPSPS